MSTPAPNSSVTPAKEGLDHPSPAAGAPMPDTAEKTHPEPAVGAAVAAGASGASGEPEPAPTSTDALETDWEDLERRGFCPIKKEFLVRGDALARIKDAIASAQESATAKGTGVRGQNKRSFEEMGNVKLKGGGLCRAAAQGVECTRDRCKFMHDVKEFLAVKPPDLGKVCRMFALTGFCPDGFACRFGGNHIDTSREVPTLAFKPAAERSPLPEEQNVISPTLKKALRTNTYAFQRSPLWKKGGRGKGGKAEKRAREAVAANDAGAAGAAKLSKLEDGSAKPADETAAAAAAAAAASIDAGVAAEQAEFVDKETPLTRRERPRLDLKGKVYVAPLTTVGNLPFRRVCKDLGADITIGEMAMSNSILSGSMSETSLLRRHPCEDIFGVQVAGSFTDALARTAEFVDRECDVDFIDINCGCPLDPVCRKGMGAGLMTRSHKLQTAVKLMCKASDAPITVKMRMAYLNSKPIATNLVKALRRTSCAAIGIHGRSRQQRYSRLANWDYIDECCKVANSELFDDDGDEVAPMPIIGNGDVMHYTDWNDHMENTGVDTCLLARGILIKPWLPTEIKEQRHWDIRSSERFDILKSFTNYGLEHWGSDDRGVNITRRFLLEWLSFLHRYVPYGLLERPPQKINARPPFYVGRDDLETLMASSQADDWVKLSEMLLGPVPDGFKFKPKHKANSYGSLAASAASTV